MQEKYCPPICSYSRCRRRLHKCNLCLILFLLLSCLSVYSWFGRFVFVAWEICSHTALNICFCQLKNCYFKGRIHCSLCVCVHLWVWEMNRLLFWHCRNRVCTALLKCSFVFFKVWLTFSNRLSSSTPKSMGYLYEQGTNIFKRTIRWWCTF